MPTTIDLIAMAGLGFFGTGHCVGMCGPIVIAIPAAGGGLSRQLLYHAGRITTYTLIGGLLGGIGGGLSRLGGMAHVATIQTGMSVLAALFLAWFALARIGLIAEPRWMSSASPIALPRYDTVSKGAVSGRRLAIFFWGMMLGTLPCGLSYAAFAKALPSGGVASGMTLALAFGIGTAPGLLLVGTVGGRLLSRHRKLSDLISGAVMASMAVVLLIDAAGTVL